MVVQCNECGRLQDVPEWSSDLRCACSPLHLTLRLIDIKRNLPLVEKVLASGASATVPLTHRAPQPVENQPVYHEPVPQLPIPEPPVQQPPVYQAPTYAPPASQPPVHQPPARFEPVRVEPARPEREHFEPALLEREHFDPEDHEAVAHEAIAPEPTRYEHESGPASVRGMRTNSVISALGLDSEAVADGEVSEKYDYLQSLGAGGMGEVVRAFDRDLQRFVAIKLLRPEIGTREGVLRFIKEAQVTGRLEHPNWGWAN